MAADIAFDDLFRNWVIEIKAGLLISLMNGYLRGLNGELVV